MSGSRRNPLRCTSTRSSGCARVGSASASRRTPSARARADWLAGDRQLRRARGARLHAHACEQPKEVEDCVAAHGVGRSSCSPPRLRRSADDDRARDACERRRARPLRAPARGLICRRPRRTLATGFAPGRPRLRAASLDCEPVGPVGRWIQLEEPASSRSRRGELRRNAISLDRLLAFGSDEGGAALCIGGGADHRRHRALSLRGVAEADILAALVSRGSGRQFRARGVSPVARSGRGTRARPASALTQAPS